MDEPVQDLAGYSGSGDGVKTTSAHLAGVYPTAFYQPGVLQHERL